MLFDNPATFIDVGKIDVRIGKDDLIDSMLADELAELFFGIDRNTFGILLSGQRCRVKPILDVWNLGRRESNDFGVFVITVATIEHMEVATGGSHD